MVLFSPHNLIKDAPFSRLDLITCRNLLIYLRQDAQKRIFDLFHFGLRPGGILFLGSSEHIDDANLLFAPIDKRHRIYVRRSGTSSTIKNFRTTQPLLATPRVPAYSQITQEMDEETAKSKQAVSTDEISVSSLVTPLKSDKRSTDLENLHLQLLEKYSPPSLIIDALC